MVADFNAVPCKRRYGIVCVGMVVSGSRYVNSGQPKHDYGDMASRIVNAHNDCKMYAASISERVDSPELIRVGQSLG